MAIYEVAIYIVPFITTPYVSRVLGTYGIGVFSYTASIVGYFVAFTQLGVNIYGRREIATCLDKETREKCFWGIWIIETAAFFLSLCFYIGLVLLTEPGIVRNALWLQIFTLAGAWLDISWFFFGVENFKLAVTRNVLVKLISLVAIFLCVKKSSDSLIYVMVMALCNFISVLPLWLQLRTYAPKIRIERLEVIKHLKPMLILFVPVISIQLYSLTGNVLLGLLTNVDEVGIYDNAYRISRVPVALITTIGTVLLPSMSRMVAEGKEVDRGLFEKSLSITLFLGLGFAFGLLSIAPVLVPVYLGDAFVRSVSVLQLLSLVLIAIAWGNCFRSMFILPKKMDNLYLRSVIYSAVINVILNLILIPFFSVIGASIASIVSEFAICIYISIKLKDYFDYKTLLSKNSIYLYSALSMVLLCLLINYIVPKPSILLLLVELLLAAFVYMILTWLLEHKRKTLVVSAEVSRLLSRLCNHRREK